MIEVVIEFNKCPTNKKDFILCLCDIFHIPRVFGWDAFKDNLHPLRFKEWTEYREIDEWDSYEEYLYEKELNSQYGLKNEDGLRDDLKIIFKNFRPFFLKNRALSTEFLDIVLNLIEETAKYSVEDGEDLLDMQICIES